MSAPRVIRARSDNPRWPLAGAGVIVCLLGGYQLGKLVFKPATAVIDTQSESADAGASSVAAAAVDASLVAPERALGPSLATVEITNTTLTGCGDGEETDLVASRCDDPAGQSAVLRRRLAAVLATCPAAPQAAGRQGSVLSIGLRVDHPRRRVAVLLGRRSTVPEKVSYVACVRESIGAMTSLWSLAHEHPRYLYFFTASFAPHAMPTAAPTAAQTTAPTTAAPTTAQTTAPTEPTASAEPAATNLPTREEMLRMRVISTATVTWSVAIVRDAPRTGAIVSRIAQGTEVEIVDRRGGWYAVRWGGDHAGWTFRQAIGL